MASSISSFTGVSTLLSWAAILCAVLASAILLWFLFWRPALSPATKLLLLFGIGIFPIGAAFTGNVTGFQHTKERTFCGSCHTMKPYTEDAIAGDSDSLASVHTRNSYFGDQSCYTCHADYGMFGTITTKIGSLSHVYSYFLKYRSMSAEDAFGEIHLFKPYPNANCMQCHSTEIVAWSDVPDHVSASNLIRSGELSCMGEGCHGPAHPFSKVGANTRGEQP